MQKWADEAVIRKLDIIPRLGFAIPFTLMQTNQSVIVPQNYIFVVIRDLAATLVT